MSGRKTTHQRAAAWALSLLLPLLCQEQASAGIRGDWNGFISQGWVLSDHNNFHGDSDGSRGSFDFRELGLNGFVEINPQLKLSAQLLSRKAGEFSDEDPDIDYLFADAALLQQLDQQAGVRIGRIKNPLGFYNETRDIAFTRPGIIMPQSIYFDHVRELQLSSDGIALYYRKPGASGNWLVDIQYGRLQTGDATEALLLGAPRQGSIGDSPVGIARILFEPSGEQWRLGLTAVDANFPFSPGPADYPISRGDVDLSMLIVSVQYNLERWSFTAEAMRAETQWNHLGIALPDDASILEAFYLQADHRFNPQWQTLLRYDDLTFNRADPDGRLFNQATGQPGHLQYAQDWTLGLRFQPSTSWELRAEVHHVRGTAWLSKQENPLPGELKPHWNLLLLQAAYRF